MGAYHGRVPTEAHTPAPWLRWFENALWHPTLRSMRGWALAGVAVNVVIVLTGATVRLSEAGLGCPSWPRCTGDSLVPVPHPGVTPLQMAIEFGNRMWSFVVLTVAAGCVVAALRLRPRRRVPVRLALLQLLGVLSQALLGGVIVLTGLRPTMVAGHFLLSAVVIAAAVGLHQRAGEGDAPARPLVRPEVTWLARALLVAVGVVLVLGTVVTGSGPHGGDPSAPRFEFSIQQVARLHAGAVWVALGLTLTLLLALRLTAAPRRARRRVAELLALEVGQGAIGYVQYWLGVPETLVWLHILGATLVWITAWRVLFALRDRGPGPVGLTPGVVAAASRTTAVAPARSPRPPGAGKHSGPRP